MSPKVWFRNFALVLVLLSLTLGQGASALAQTADEATPATEVDDADSSDDAAEVEEKGEFTPGESSSVESGAQNVFLPLTTNSGSGNVSAAAPEASWQTIFYDEFCSFPTGWSRYNSNGTSSGATSHLWTKQTVGGLCVARPNAYVNRMNTNMSRTFSLVGALNARMTFRFYMNTELGYDYLRYEYSCNGGGLWRGGTTHAASGNVPNWTIRTVSLANCVGASSVRVRFIFETDQSIGGAVAPTLDYVRVEKYQ